MLMHLPPYQAWDLVKAAGLGARRHHDDARTNEDGHWAIHADECTHTHCVNLQKSIKALADAILSHVGVPGWDECEENCPRCEYEKWGA